MLSSVLNKEIELKDLFSKRDLLEFEVANIIEHILADPEDFKYGKSCGGSEFRDIVKAGMNGELGERYRLMKNPYNGKAVKRFVDMILKF